MAKRSLSRPHGQRWSYQEDFLDWLADNQKYFRFAPQELVVTPGFVAFRLAGLSPLLRVSVFDSRIRVEAYWGSLYLGDLIEFSMQPAPGPAELFLCWHCEQLENAERLYPDLASMRREHLYLPFLLWLDEALPEGEELEIVQFKNGYTTVRLFPYSYRTPSLHFEDFMEQLEMKFALRPYDHSPFAGRNIGGFCYVPLFDAPENIDLNPCP